MSRCFRSARTIRQIVTLLFLTALSSLTVSGADVNPIVVNNILVGQSPQGVAVNVATSRVYVANGDFDTVSVIDASTETVIATIPVGNQPVGVAVNTTTDRIYVANYSDNTLSVIDGIANIVTTTIPMGSNPLGVAVNDVINRIYVTNLSSNTVSVIDGATDTVIATIPVETNPYGVDVDPFGSRIYVANFTSGSLSIIDGFTNTVLMTLANLVVWPTGVGVNSTTNRIYVSSWIVNSPVKVIDGATNTVVASVTPGTNRALGVTVDEIRNVVHVAYRWGGGAGGSLATIDGATNTLMSSLFICCQGAPLYAAVNPVTDRVYVSLPGWCCNPAEARWVAVVANRPASANVGITKSDAPDPVAWVDNLTYTMPVTNYGPGPAADVRVTDTLPAAAAFVAAMPDVSISQDHSAGCMYQQMSHLVTCELGTLPSGSTTTVTIVVQPLHGGTITNTASVTSTTPDPSMTNNAASATTEVTGPPNAPPACGHVPPQAKPPICP